MKCYRKKNLREDMRFGIKLITLSLIAVVIISCNKTKLENEIVKKPNLLFIIIDDLNSDISAEGGPIKTPNIDRLASNGVQFTRAYVQQPVCAASRSSFLTGLRPNTTGVDYPYSYYFVEELYPRVGTISEYFDARGYHVKQFGKVHHGFPNKYQVETVNPQKGQYVSDELNNDAEEYGQRTLPPYEKTVEGDEEYIDYVMTTDVIKELQSIDKSRPFCILAGFRKPHRVYSAPQKYWDLYNREKIAPAIPKELSEGTSKLAVSQHYLKQYKWETSNLEVPFSDNYTKLIKHAYYASSSFMDNQIGRIIKELEENGLKDNTIIVLVSDHGYMLGEQNTWGKTNLFEKGLRVPFIVSWKGKIKPGVKTDALVEAVDIFPTIIDLAGFNIPDYLEGTSVKPLLKNPNMEWKSGVYSQQPRGENNEWEGVSLRTDRYRYNEWFDKTNGKILAKELFDYEIDPTESKNLVNNREYKDIVKRLSEELSDGWKSKLPRGIVNNSNNPVAPPSYAWGDQGIKRRTQWHKTYGGKEEDGWRIATKLREEQEKMIIIN